MSNSLSRVDVLAVYAELSESGEMWSDYSNGSVRLDDGIKVMVSGWHCQSGWSRGYQIITDDSTGYIGPVDRNERYSGRGWKPRMVADILQDLEGLRNPEVGDVDKA